MNVPISHRCPDDCSGIFTSMLDIQLRDVLLPFCHKDTAGSCVFWLSRMPQSRWWSISFWYPYDCSWCLQAHHISSSRMVCSLFVTRTLPSATLCSLEIPKPQLMMNNFPMLPRLFRDDAEGQMHERGLVVTEPGENISLLHPPFDYKLVCGALQDFDSSMALFSCPKLTMSCTR